MFPLYTGKRIVPVPLPSPQESKCNVTEKDMLLMMVAHHQHHMMTVSTIEKAAVNPRTSSPGSSKEPCEENLGNKAVSLPVGNLDPPPCPPT
ncbi:hypothetical protein JOQ06_028253 [Pogonophryne albipinna]|uniref:Uncharacterized protein n=1 Tax=Pogonophryne albipinna TaxID=1090488 RepID=A0AAD6FKX0_9TELE|nr:hypothetical protein JOQ06_028253 [Pogonophryne albipinna]